METYTFDVSHVNGDANKGMMPGFVGSIYKTFDNKDQKKKIKKLN